MGSSILSGSNKVLLTKLAFALTVSLTITTFAAFMLLGTLVTTGNLISLLFSNFLLAGLFLVILYLSWKAVDMLSFKHK